MLPNLAAEVPRPPRVNVPAVFVVSEPKLAKAPDAIERFPLIIPALLKVFVPPDKARLLKLIVDEEPPIVCPTPLSEIVPEPGTKVPPLLVQFPEIKCVNDPAVNELPLLIVTAFAVMAAFKVTDPPVFAIVRLLIVVLEKLAFWFAAPSKV